MTLSSSSPLEFDVPIIEMFPYSVKDYSKESFLENVFLFNLAPACFLAYTK